MLILTIIVFLVILIISHELGHFLAAKRFGVRVDEFGFGLPPRIASRQKGETRYSLNLLPLGGFVKIYGQHEGEEKLEEPRRAFINQPIWRRAIILIAGVTANFIIGWLALSLVFMVGVPSKLFITDVLSGSAAEAAGLKTNESINGFNSTEEFINFIQSHRNQLVTINNKTVKVPQEGIIGVRIESFGITKQNPFRSLVTGFEAAGGVTAGIIKSAGKILVNAINREPGSLNQLAGPVGIFNIIKQAEGSTLLIYLLGIISLNLAVFNLLPVPALDGGHLLFLGIEKILGQRLPRRAEAIANAVGFALLILLIIVVTFKDIGRL